MDNLISGFNKGLWTTEHIMENAMKYSMAGVLDDSDLAALAAHTAPVIEEPVVEDAENAFEDVENVTEEEVSEETTEPTETGENESADESGEDIADETEN